MPFVPIADASDERIADFRLVSDPELARARGLFVAEGRLVVSRLIEDGRFRVQSVLVNDAARRTLAAPLERASAQVPIYICRASLIPEITGYNLHRGCVALGVRPAPDALGDVLGAGSSAVVLEGVANADNVGGIFRNAAAFGVAGAILSPTCCDPLYRKAIRTSMGATLRVPFAWAGDWPGVLTEIRRAGFTIVALTPREPSERLDQFAALPFARLALVVGTEGAGLSPAVEATADHRVRIPVRHDVDSLNVAVAAGIAMARLFTLDAVR